MWLTTDAGIDSVFNYNPIGLNGGTGLGADEVSAQRRSRFPALVQGIEVYGIVEHRLLYTAGIGNGISAGNGQFEATTRRTSTARLDYKIGGMGLDGDTGGQGGAGQELARQLASRSACSSTAATRSDINFPLDRRERASTINIQDAHFLRTGFFASAYFEDLNVFGGYVHGKDTLQQFDADDRRPPQRDRADLRRLVRRRPTTSSIPGCTAPPATRP